MNGKTRSEPATASKPSKQANARPTIDPKNQNEKNPSDKRARDSAAQKNTASKNVISGLTWVLLIGLLSIISPLVLVVIILFPALPLPHMLGFFIALVAPPLLLYEYVPRLKNFYSWLVLQIVCLLIVCWLVFINLVR
jgi:hypothetical protein